VRACAGRVRCVVVRADGSNGGLKLAISPNSLWLWQVDALSAVR
jgi:hypothetical protein